MNQGYNFLEGSFSNRDNVHTKIRNMLEHAGITLNHLKWADIISKELEQDGTGLFHVNSTRIPQVTLSDFAETLYICCNKWK